MAAAVAAEDAVGDTDMVTGIMVTDTDQDLGVDMADMDLGVMDLLEAIFTVDLSHFIR